MEAKTRGYWWWFDSHSSARCSPWLQSTLTELNEKTKGMLKLIEEDADSFAQRAEMYYQKRPELISMVEDFYRAHRSLAERYDQLRHHPSAHPKSPLRQSLPLPKGKYDDILNSIKSFDSFTEVGYHSEESEIHDPEEHHTHVHQDIEGDIENPLRAASYDELMKLSEELDRLREENKLQRNLIEQKDKENDEHLMKLKDEIEKLKVQNMKMKEELKQKEVEKTVAKRQFHEAKHELIKLRQVMQAENLEKLKVLNMKMEEELKQKEVEKTEAQKQFHEAKQESIKLREVMQSENRRLKEAMAEKDEEKREVIRQLSSAMEILREESRLPRKSIKPKKSGEVQIFKGISLGKLFTLSPKCQTSVVPMQM